MARTGPVWEMLKEVQGTPFVDMDPGMRTGVEMLRYMEGPLRKFTDKVDAILAGFDRRIAALEAARQAGQDLDCI